MEVIKRLLEISIYSGIIYLAIIAMKKVFYKKMSPLMHYAIWLLLVVRLMVPFTLDSGFNLIIIPHAKFQAEAVVSAKADVLKDSMSYENESAPLNDSSASNHAAVLDRAAETAAVQYALPAKKSAYSLNVSEVIIMLWLAGIVFSAVHTLVSYFRVRKRIQKNTVPPTKHLQRLFEECREELGISKRLKVVGHYGLETPALFFPSLILMPVSSLVSMNDVQIKYALRHELIHYKHKDHYASLLLVLLQCVYWFNPFVWLASKKIRMDMEVACDHAVVRRLNGIEKTFYANMIVSLFTRTLNRQMVLGLAQGNAKKAARQRVQGIFMSGKTKKSAKLVWVLTAAVLLLSCFTTACQPTPEKAVVVNKADGKLEEKISESAPAQVQYSAPENLKESFTCKDENVQVNVDANVMLPRAKQYPVVDIVPEEISMDFVKTAAKVLMEGKMLYEPRTTLTKSEIQSEVLKLQKTLADPKHSTSDGLNAGDPKIVADTKKLFEDRIKIYQELLKTAPETYTPVEAKLEFKSIKYYEDQAFYKEQEAEWKKLKDDDQAKQLLDQYEHGQKLVLDAELGNGYHGRLTVENYNGEASRWNRLQFRKGTELNNQYGPDLGADVRETNMSKETAAALGQDLLSKLEIADMLLTSVSPISSNQSKKDIKPQAAVSAEDASGKTYGYTLVFNRSFGGIPTITENSSFKADVEDYGPYYALESIRIVVQNDEIVSFDWNNPSKQVEIENSSVALKSFEEIKKLFKNQMSLEYNLGKLSLIEPENPDYEKYVANLASGKITIDKIQLGMVRLSIKDRPWVYRMIPAWKFYGNEFVELKTKNDDFPSKVNQISCFETINAIDGSVIDGK